MREAILQSGALWGAVVGLLLGLLPLAAGLYRRRHKSAFLTHFVTVVIGALFGFYGALIFAIFTAGPLWRGEPIKWFGRESGK
jgi:hypothetical protein